MHVRYVDHNLPDLGMTCGASWLRGSVYDLQARDRRFDRRLG